MHSITIKSSIGDIPNILKNVKGLESKLHMISVNKKFTVLTTESLSDYMHLCNLLPNIYSDGKESVVYNESTAAADVANADAAVMDKEEEDDTKKDDKAEGKKTEKERKLEGISYGVQDKSGKSGVILVKMNSEGTKLVASKTEGEIVFDGAEYNPDMSEGDIMDILSGQFEKVSTTVDKNDNNTSKNESVKNIRKSILESVSAEDPDDMKDEEDMPADDNKDDETTEALAVGDEVDFDGQHCVIDSIDEKGNVTMTNDKGEEVVANISDIDIDNDANTEESLMVEKGKVMKKKKKSAKVRKDKGKKHKMKKAKK